MLTIGDAHVVSFSMRAVASTLLPSPEGEHLLEVEPEAEPSARAASYRGCRPIWSTLRAVNVRLHL